VYVVKKKDNSYSPLKPHLLPVEWESHPAKPGVLGPLIPQLVTGRFTLDFSSRFMLYLHLIMLIQNIPATILKGAKKNKAQICGCGMILLDPEKEKLGGYGKGHWIRELESDRQGTSIPREWGVEGKQGFVEEIIH
jgi:hypothetical protein